MNPTKIILQRGNIWQDAWQAPRIPLTPCILYFVLCFLEKIVACMMWSYKSDPKIIDWLDLISSYLIKCAPYSIVRSNFKTRLNYYFEFGRWALCIFNVTFYCFQLCSQTFIIQPMYVVRLINYCVKKLYPKNRLAFIILVAQSGDKPRNTLLALCILRGDLVVLLLTWS